MFKTFPKAKGESHSAFIVFNDTTGQTSLEQKSWIEQFENKITAPVVNYLFSH